MDNQDAIRVLESMKKEYVQALEIGSVPDLHKNQYKKYVNAYDLSIKALEKQVFFESQVSNISDWFVDNRDSLLDTALTVSTKSFNQYNENGKIDDVDLEFIVLDIVDEIQKGILNVLSTYIG